VWQEAYLWSPAELSSRAPGRLNLDRPTSSSGSSAGPWASGGIEEKWGPKNPLTNRVTLTIGFGLGQLLVIVILAHPAQLFGPVNVSPEFPGTAAL
jgi:hypothetical protein